MAENKFMQWRNGLVRLGFQRTEQPPFCMWRVSNGKLFLLFFHAQQTHVLNAAISAWFRRNPDYINRGIHELAAKGVVVNLQHALAVEARATG